MKAERVWGQIELKAADPRRPSCFDTREALVGGLIAIWMREVG